MPSTGIVITPIMAKLIALFDNNLEIPYNTKVAPNQGRTATIVVKGAGLGIYFSLPKDAADHHGCGPQKSNACASSLLLLMAQAPAARYMVNHCQSLALM
jgi:hypothetical protein